VQIGRWWLVLLLGCQQGRQPPDPKPVPIVVADAAITDARADAHVVTIDELVDALAGDREVPVCFAVSANHRRVACVVESEMWDNALVGSREVHILGDLGTATSEWTYLESGQESDGVYRGHVEEAIDHHAIDELRRALVDRHYEVFDAAGTPLITEATTGGHTVRRHRVSQGPAYLFEDQLELSCHGRWVRIPLDEPLQISQGTIDDVAMRVSAFDERRILLEVDSSYGYEGGRTIVRGAQLVDVAALCQR
jgi:hypothetical protein